MMTSAQAVETSVNVTSNSPSQEYNQPDDRNLQTYDISYSRAVWLGFCNVSISCHFIVKDCQISLDYWLFV